MCIRDSVHAVTGYFKRVLQLGGVFPAWRGPDPKKVKSPRKPPRRPPRRPPGAPDAPPKHCRLKGMVVYSGPAASPSRPRGRQERDQEPCTQTGV